MRSSALKTDDGLSGKVQDHCKGGIRKRPGWPRCMVVPTACFRSRLQDQGVLLHDHTGHDYPELSGVWILIGIRYKISQLQREYNTFHLEPS